VFLAHKEKRCGRIVKELKVMLSLLKIDFVNYNILKQIKTKNLK